MAQHLAAERALDVVVGGAPTQAREAHDRIVVLRAPLARVQAEQLGRLLLLLLGGEGSDAGALCSGTRLGLDTDGVLRALVFGQRARELDTARMGVECAVLAKMGWTANADVFGPKGFFDTFLGGDARPELLIEGFASPLRMVVPGVGFKKHPSNYFTHRPIDAARPVPDRTTPVSSQAVWPAVNSRRFHPFPTLHRYPSTTPSTSPL